MGQLSTFEPLVGCGVCEHWRERERRKKGNIEIEERETEINKNKRTREGENGWIQIR